MAKNQTVDKSKMGCYYSAVSADFTQIERPNNQFESIVPMFNLDGSYCTPTFILPSEQQYFTKNIKFEKEKFEERILGAHEKKSNQTFLNPLPSSQYCMICKETFQDYLQHTNYKSHLRRMRASKANKFITDLVKGLTKQTQQADKIQKTKQISKIPIKKVDIKNSKKIDMKEHKISSLIKPNGTQTKITNNSTNIGSQIIGIL